MRGMPFSDIQKLKMLIFVTSDPETEDTCIRKKVYVMQVVSDLTLFLQKRHRKRKPDIKKKCCSNFIVIGEMKINILRNIISYPPAWTLSDNKYITG